MKPGDKLVSQTGEFNLIDRIRNIFPATVHSDILVGMGDDTAVLRLDDDRVLLVTCDIQIEDRHFRQDFISAYQLGRRSIAVNISDIAAMGGNPTFALASLGLPEGMTVREYDNLFQGMRDELQQHGAALIGGNLARSENKLIVDITLLGEVSKSGYVTREGAREGDGVYVTGVVGASGSGLEVLKKFGQNYPEKYRQLVEAHLLPDARVSAGRALASGNHVSAMIDVSDGIASDLYHICTSSNVGAVIYQNQLPLPRFLEEVSEFSGKDITELALHSGEDYELLFTASHNKFPQIQQDISENLRLAITKIGNIVSREKGYMLIDSEGKEEQLQPRGWDHFRDS